MANETAVKQHAYGSGEIFFARYLTGTTNPGAEIYLGNTTEFTLNTATEKLDHFDADHGIRELDDSVQTSTSMGGTVVTDNINPANLALLLLGTTSTISTSSATGVIDNIAAAELNGWYQLGTSASRPSGYRKVASVVVTNSAGSTTYVAGTDYLVDLDRARVKIIEGGAITAGQAVKITYNVSASTRTQIVSGNNYIEGALRFLSYNPKGLKIDYFMPQVSLAPDGDFALKGEDWLTIPFTLDVKKKGDLARVYADGVAVAS